MSVPSDVDEDEDAYTDEDSELDEPIGNHDWLPKVPETASPSHAKHWSSRISSQMWNFRKYVHAAMLAVFKVNPSLRLYSAILANSTSPETTAAELMTYLNEMAPSCPEVFAAALDIHSLERNTITLASLLSSHSHLIRPRDAPIYQSAVTTLGADPFQQQRALEIIEKELLDTANAVRAPLLASFSLLETPENKAEIEQILKLRPSAGGRQDRIERWVDAVITPGTNTPNPMALAAMVMGLPIVPVLDGMDDADPLGYLDLDPTDPDMEDLRDEFRPRLKQRFEGWADSGIAVKGGQTILVKVYRELVKTMPWLRASDVVEEMMARRVPRSHEFLLDRALTTCLSMFLSSTGSRTSRANSSLLTLSTRCLPSSRSSGASSQPLSRNRSAARPLRHRPLPPWAPPRLRRSRSLYRPLRRLLNPRLMSGLRPRRPHWSLSHLHLRHCSRSTRVLYPDQAVGRCMGVGLRTSISGQTEDYIINFSSASFVYSVRYLRSFSER